MWSVLRNLWAGGLLSSGYERPQDSLQHYQHQHVHPGSRLSPCSPKDCLSPASLQVRYAHRSDPASWVLLELGPKFGSHMVLAWTAGSQYPVNASAQKSGAISWVYQGRARESCFPAKRQTIALRSKGRQMATRHISRWHPWLAKTSPWLA